MRPGQRPTLPGKPWRTQNSQAAPAASTRSWSGTHMHAHPLPCPGLCAPHAYPEASKVTLFSPDAKWRHPIQGSCRGLQTRMHGRPSPAQAEEGQPMGKERVQLLSGTAAALDRGHRHGRAPAPHRLHAPSSSCSGLSARHTSPGASPSALPQTSLAPRARVRHAGSARRQTLLIRERSASSARQALTRPPSCQSQTCSPCGSGRSLRSAQS